MPLPYRHEQVAPNLHRFVFPSASRPGLEHELLLDLDAEGPDRLSCLCEAALHGKLCKHKRAIIRSEFGRRLLRPMRADGAAPPSRPARSRAAKRWIERRGRAVR